MLQKKSYSIFDGKLCKQVEGEVMGSPLDPTLFDAFLFYFENCL